MKKHNVIIATILLFSGATFTTLAQQNGKTKKPKAPKNAVMVKDVTKDTTAANHTTKLPPPKTN